MSLRCQDRFNVSSEAIYIFNENMNAVAEKPRTEYAVHFSDYEGGATIGTFLAHAAEARGIEMAVLYAMVPAYDFSQGNATAEEIAGLAKGQLRRKHDELVLALERRFAVTMPRWTAGTPRSFRTA